MSDPLIEVRNLKKFFPIKRGLLSRTVGEVKAVNDLSFEIKAGETLGLVGGVGVRQDDDRTIAAAADRADCRIGLLRGEGCDEDG